MICLKYFVLILFLWIGIACGSRGKSVVREASPGGVVQVINVTDSLKPDTIQFGRMFQGETLRKELMLRNMGDQPMIILSATTSCGCTSVEFERKPVLPGNDASFSFELNTTGLSGYQLKHITMRTTLSKNPFTFVVTGEVEPPKPE